MILSRRTYGEFDAEHELIQDLLSVGMDGSNVVISDHLTLDQAKALIVALVDENVMLRRRIHA